MKPKILVLTSTFPRWQQDHLPSFVYELSKRLARRLDVHVLAPYSEGSKLREIIDGMHVYRYRYWPSRRPLLSETAILPSLKKHKWLWGVVPFFLASQFLHLLWILHKEAIETIHAHWIIPQGFLAVLYKEIFNRDLRVIITAHGSDIFGLKSLGFLKRWTIKRCATLAVVSRALKTEVDRLGLGSVPVTIIPMGVDLRQFHPDQYDESLRAQYNPRGPLLLFVGRLTALKGVDYLIRAMSEVSTVYPDVKLLIIGYGEEQERLEYLAKDLNLLDRHVVFIGGLPNSELPRYYATSDIFVGPSITLQGGDREGFGLVFVEALGSGCVAIASDLPSITDIVVDGKTGLVVQEKDSAAIARAILVLLQDKDRLSRLKKKGRSYVLERFDWELVSEKYKELLLR